MSPTIFTDENVFSLDLATMLKILLLPTLESPTKCFDANQCHRGEYLKFHVTLQKRHIK